MSLTTLADLKSRLGLSGTGEDDVLILLISQADSFISGHTNRTFESQSWTEYLDGNGRRSLYLEQRPVTAVTNLYVDSEGYYGQKAGGFAADTEWTSGVDFALTRVDESEKNRGRLVALKHREFYDSDGGFFPVGLGNVKVVYTAGYATIPDDLAGAAQVLISIWRGAAEKGVPLRSETLDEYTYELMSGGDSAVANALASTLSRYTLEVVG